MEVSNQITYQKLNLNGKFKKEHFNLLVYDIRIVLLPIKEAYTKFISDILIGTKPVRDISYYLST